MLVGAEGFEPFHLRTDHSKSERLTFRAGILIPSKINEVPAATVETSVGIFRTGEGFWDDTFELTSCMMHRSKVIACQVG